METISLSFAELNFLNSTKKVTENCQMPYKNHPHGCPNYNHNWSCPPYAPSVEETRNTLETYSYLWIILITQDIPSYKPKIFQKQQMKKHYPQLTYHCNHFLAYLREKHKDWKIYFCSECSLCMEKRFHSCTCPQEPCRFPDEIRISPEAAGIDLNTTLKNSENPLEWPPKTRIVRIGLCATHEKVNLSKLYKEFLI